VLEPGANNKKAGIAGFFVADGRAQSHKKGVSSVTPMVRNA
jgi:hypothetical protein